MQVYSLKGGCYRKNWRKRERLRCSNHLSYVPKMAGTAGLEPTTYGLPMRSNRFLHCPTVHFQKYRGEWSRPAQFGIKSPKYPSTALPRYKNKIARLLCRGRTLVFDNMGCHLHLTIRSVTRFFSFGLKGIHIFLKIFFGRGNGFT